MASESKKRLNRRTASSKLRHFLSGGQDACGTILVSSRESTKGKIPAGTALQTCASNKWRFFRDLRVRIGILSESTWFDRWRSCFNVGAEPGTTRMKTRQEDHSHKQSLLCLFNVERNCLERHSISMSDSNTYRKRMRVPKKFFGQRNGENRVRSVTPLRVVTLWMGTYP